MATKVFPTVGDVGGAGAGIKLSEANLAYWLKQLLGQNFVLSGFTVPASSADLTLSVALGEANISGYRVVIDAATTVTCTASNTNHIYLKLTRDGLGNVTTASFEVNITGVAPTDSVKIATAVAGVSSISSTTDARQLRALAVSQMDGATPDQAQAPASPGTGTLAQVLSWLSNRVKAITGATNWWDAPAATIAAIWAQFNATTGHKHTGGADDAPKIPVASIEVDIATQAEMDAKFDASTGHKHTGAAGDGPAILLAVFGDGSDGDVTLATNTTLTRDMYYNNLTINSGVTLSTGGYRIFVKNTLTNNGTIDCSGAPGTDSTGGSAAGGNGGASGSLAGGGRGGDGSNGANGNPGVDGNVGGAGGSSGVVTGYTAGAGGSASLPASSGGWRYLVRAIEMQDLGTAFKGGAGGGGGPAAAGSAGGGGGGGGGVVVISAAILVNNGAIKSEGGKGGNGRSGADSAGGGGGGGGVISLIYRSKSGTGTISVAGGAKGLLGGGSGTDGVAGAAGIQLEVVA